MEAELDDFPLGFAGGNNWEAVELHLRTWWVNYAANSVRILGVARSDDPLDGITSSSRHRPPQWAEQHRRAAREYARRKRAAEIGNNEKSTIK